MIITKGGVIFVEDIIIANNGISLNLDSALLKRMHTVATIDYRSTESGGVLLGYKLQGKSEYRITEFTAPFSNDIISWASFNRRDKKHVDRIHEAWKIDHSIVYLGDWHSHPIDSSTPSKTDTDAWEGIAVQSRTIADTLFFFLVIPNGISIYLYSRKGNYLYYQNIPRDQF
jgi:integrative and conjugative element protein (TIGR02256 family)